MATTMRGGGLGKEKRGASTSTPIIKKSPKSLSSTKTSSSSSTSATKTSSTSESKSVPNYLRPTISSSNDPSRVPKKTILDSPALKPTLDRRRSFDRPPPLSQVQRATRNGPGTRDVKPLRSSSFSHKTTTTTSTTTTTPLASSSSLRQATSERPSSRKDVKGESHLSKAQGLKKSTLSNTTTKKDSNKDTSSTKKTPENVTPESSIDQDSHAVDHLANEDDLVNIDDEVESLQEISDMNVSSKELGDPTNIEIETKQPVEDQKNTAIEDDYPQEDIDESVADDHHIADLHESISQEHNNDGEQNQTVDEQSEQETVEETIDYQEQEQEQVDDRKQDQTEENAGESDEAHHEESKENPTETLVEEKKEDEPSNKEADKVLEETEANKEEKQTVNNPSAVAASSVPVVTAPMKAQSVGKKENQAYNDVIEETATKLRSKKNKVLALAGAFETVISLQDTNKN